jgi:CheY-like chemotaxis protein
LRILLAEDNIVNQRLAVLLLEKHGHIVSVVGDGKQAVAALDSREFDIALMDIQMPKLNGLEATKVIRAKEKRTGKRLPLVAMTAHAMKGDRDTCLAAGMDGYISKPIRALKLFEVIDNLLGTSSREEASEATLERGDRPFDESMVLARVEGNHQVLVELIETFLGEYPGLMTEVREAVDLRDAVRLAQAADALKEQFAT